MRIASLSPAATEILFRMDLGGDIVCVDQFSNFPDEAKAIPRVKDHQKISPDELRTHNPEVVLTETVVQEKLSHLLKSEGFGVIHKDPRTIQQIIETIRQYGSLFACEDRAEGLVLSIQQGINAVKKRAALLPSKPKVYVEEWHQPPMASGNWVPELVRLSGGTPFPIRDGELSREVSLEEVSAFDPDLLVISWCGAGSLADKTLLEKRPGWDALRVVRENRIRVIDDSLLNRPGPRLVDGAQRLYSWMFELLH